MSHDKLATDIPVVNNRTESENGVSAMAEQVHMMIRAQAGDFIGKEFEDGTALNKLNFDKVIQSVHPHLWSWIWVVLYGEGAQIPTAMPLETQRQTKCLRAIHVLSSLLHAAKPQCVFPLQLVLADVVETYSHSTTLLATLSRFGITAGRDTYDRYKMTIIKQRQERGIQNELMLNSLCCASIDNIDKDMKWKRMYCNDAKRGFHGTSVQHINPQPKAAMHTEQPEVEPSKVLPFTCFESNDSIQEPPCKRARIRTQRETPRTNRLQNDVFIDSSVTPEVTVQQQESETVTAMAQAHTTAQCTVTTQVMCHNSENLPTPDTSIQDGVQDWYDPHQLSLSNFVITDNDEKCIKEVKSEAFAHLSETDGTDSLKDFVQEQGGEQPEAANVVYLGILDKPADNRETIKSILNDLYGTYGIGTRQQHLLVVGDGKTYDILLKLRQEYGKTLSWLVPFPGDWHMLKAIQPIIMKVYWDAGLNSMAKAMSIKGEALSAVERCSTFRKTHDFLLWAHEAIGRSMLEAYKTQHPSTNVTSPTMERLEEFSNTSTDEVWKLWANFYFRDMFAYVALWSAIRGGNWQRRVAAIKMAAPLFHALDRTTYLRLVPQHLAHIQCIPPSIRQHLENGSFSISLNGSYFNSVAIDEAHEMKINRDMKMSMVHPEEASIDRLTYYLPHRAELLR
eukprot:scpid71142/ scgid18217/ 